MINRLGASSYWCWLVVGFGLMCPSLSADEVTPAQWRQWGGPDRNFVVDTSSLADKWPDAGPKRLWRRKLGTGYSGIAVDNGVLYTMYRTSRTSKYESVIALDAATGKTLWQHREVAKLPPPPPPELNDTSWRTFTGPNATPLVVGERVFTVGKNAIVLCLNTADGKVQWKKDLESEFEPQPMNYGFASSPIAFGNTIIVPIGQADLNASDNRSLIAYNQATGDVVWKSQVFQSSHSSPILIDFQGTKQLVFLNRHAMLGINPRDGSFLWKFEYPDMGDEGSFNAAPVFDGKDTIYFSNYHAGCAIKLIQNDSETTVRQLWLSRRVPLGMGTSIYVNGLLIGAKAGNNAAFMAVDMQTGKRVWFKRHFVGATILGDHQKQIVLDEDGELSLIKAGPEGLSIESQFQATIKRSFTAPSLVGSTLYVRDEKHIMAFDLSIKANKREA